MVEGGMGKTKEIQSARPNTQEAPKPVTAMRW